MKIIRWFIILMLLLPFSSYMPSLAQVRQSPTPIIVNLITSTPVSGQQSIATVTPTFTPTPRGPVLLEAREDSGSVNVRAEPDPNSERLGSISFGTQYPVLRQFYSWYELQYELSPSGRAWVYGELVEILGNPSEIEVVDTLQIEPTQNPLDLQATETWIAITVAPGGVQTVTANARVLNVPTISDDNPASSILEETPLPTFTYPPDAIAFVPTPIEGADSTTSNNSLPSGHIPPLLPIILLGGFGIIGLLFNSVRS